ncbi:YwpF-like family protein [Aquibacillus koreensis]|uniref:YwpF-like family protein n=1 Tax=Aquibacillus koreensis TaxID=279446 RepID=A0A9X3WLZ8_9BACI|nr:YwpF-like family protein [Aquibacillus koreensis]MCT2534345.1 YwpF-like family protein [Aquibacillus koreensis]MDC3420666.1 YwpF-like family protein [Aquibacillus koreensis]
MKTFKLIALEVFEESGENKLSHPIPLLDGLIIDREDEINQWVIEALLKRSQLDFFNQLQKNKPFMVQVKITKDSNRPATFVVTILTINEIDDHISILLLGTLADQKKGVFEKRLATLIDKGYEGSELLDKFKDSV